MGMRQGPGKWLDEATERLGVLRDRFVAGQVHAVSQLGAGSLVGGGPVIGGHGDLLADLAGGVWEGLAVCFQVLGGGLDGLTGVGRASSEG
jgi:hypothetical protein